MHSNKLDILLICVAIVKEEYIEVN